MVMETTEAQLLHEIEFFGKLMGERLQLSLLETAYLMEIGVVILRHSTTGRTIDLDDFKEKARQIQADFDLRLHIYKDLKARGLIVKTGFKYGTHFRAYEADPDHHHAKYLFHALPPGFTSTWPEISRAVRLSHGVKKEMLFGMKLRQGGRYLNLKRVRP
jgi:tRNA-intron endonuclease